MFINDLLLFLHARGRRLENNWIRVHELFQLDQIEDEHDRQNVVYRFFSHAFWKSGDELTYKFPNGESIVVQRHQKDTEADGINGGRWWIRRRLDLEKERTQPRKKRGETTGETKEDKAWIKIFPGEGTGNYDTRGGFHTPSVLDPPPNQRDHKNKLVKAARIVTNKARTMLNGVLRKLLAHWHELEDIFAIRMDRALQIKNKQDAPKENISS